MLRIILCIAICSPRGVAIILFMKSIVCLELEQQVVATSSPHCLTVFKKGFLLELAMGEKINRGAGYGLEIVPCVWTKSRQAKRS